jgi:hypothetical protein
MTAIAADNVSVSLAARDLQVTAGSKIFCLPTVTFGNGTLTYPAGGVPLPGIGQFGFKRQVDRLIIQQPSANGFVYKYDADNHKIKIFTQGVTTGDTAVGATEDGALVLDSQGAETDVRLSNTAAETSYDMGALIELPATAAPPEVSLLCVAIGE